MFKTAINLRLIVVSTFLVLTAAVSSYAQPMAKGERLLVTVVDIKPEMVNEYETFVKTETIPALKKAGVTRRDAWVTSVFGQSYRYIYVQPIVNYSEFDGPSPFQKALGNGYDAWLAKSRTFQTSLKRYVVDTRPDLSYIKENVTPFGTVAVVSHATAAAGRTAEVESWVKSDLLPAMRRSDVPGYRVSKVSLGGNANEYITLVLHANMAELEKGPPVYRVMSKDDGDKLYAKLAAGALTNVERYVVKLSGDLSIREQK